MYPVSRIPAHLGPAAHLLGNRVLGASLGRVGRPRPWPGCRGREGRASGGSLHMHTCTHRDEHTQGHKYVHTQACAQTHMCTHGCAHTGTHTGTCTHRHTRTHTDRHICTGTHTHTPIPSHRPREARGTGAVMRLRAGTPRTAAAPRPRLEQREQRGAHRQEAAEEAPGPLLLEARPSTRGQRWVLPTPATVPR